MTVREAPAEAYPLHWPEGWERRAEYRVTRDGRIFSVRNGRLHELAQHPDQDGYLTVLVFVAPGKRRNLRVHRAVCQTFRGDRPDGHVVRHLDGDKRNNRVENLCWGTVAENSADAMKHGHVAKGKRNGAYTKPHRRPRGMRNGNAKLTAMQALAIFRDERVQDVIAKDYGITQGAVAHIKNGRTWSHVTGEVHPDRGGSTTAMAELNAAWAEYRRLNPDA